MEYGGDNPNPMGAESPVGGSDMPEQTGKDYSPVTVDASALGGMDVSEGDIIEFRVSKKMENGQVELIYNTEGGGEKGDKSESWEDMTRREMSPRTPQGEAA